MKEKALCLAVVSILTIALGSAWAAGTYLPFGDGFESGAEDGALNTNGWYTSTTGVARTENAAAKGYATVDGSAQAAYISDELNFVADTAAGEWTNVWCSFYSKVTTQSSDPGHLDVSTVAGFYVQSDGQVMAYSNNAWVSVATGVPTSGWLGFAVHLDYNEDEWDIYKTPNTYSYGDELTKLNAYGPLAFKAGASPTELTQVSIEGTTYLDELAVSYDDDPVASSPPNAANAGINIILGENLTGVLTKYFDPADCGMDGPLGIAMSSGLLLNDVVYVYQSGAWTTLTCSGPGQGFTSSGGYPVIRPTTAVFVEFGATAGTRAPARVAAYSSLQQPSATTPVLNGWNALAVPHGAVNVTVGTLGLPSPQEGDQIWVKRLTGGYEIPIYWSGAAWLQGRTDVTGMGLSGGQAFWYRRAGTGTNWDASGLTVN